MQSLEKRFAKGLGWGLIDNFSGTGINFLVGILLARQLTPEIFGIVGFASKKSVRRIILRLFSSTWRRPLSCIRYSSLPLH